MMAGVQEFDFSVDVLRAILWQYDGVAGLRAILEGKAAWYLNRHASFWAAWVSDVFDLRTANEFGCSVWGQILGIPLSLEQPASGTRPVWGFGSHNRNFGRGGFGRKVAGIAALSLEQKRIALRLRYFQITSDGSVPYANFALREVLGAGYVVDNLDMTAVCVFPTAPPSATLAVLREFDLLPRPAGVEMAILVDPGARFGFGPSYRNYNNGTFGG